MAKSFTSKTIKGKIANSNLLSWYNALATKTSYTLSQDLNNLMNELDANGITTELDLFHPIGGLETDEQRLAPIKTTGTSPMTAVNSPTLGTNGVNGNATTSYINTNWKPSTQAVKYVRNSNCFGVYTKTQSSNNYIEIGALDGASQSYLYSKGATDNQIGTANDNVLLSKATTISIGTKVITRLGANSRFHYENGNILGSDATASAVVVTANFYICAADDSGTGLLGAGSRVVACFFTGSSVPNQGQLHTCINSYMIARGINVVG